MYRKQPWHDSDGIGALALSMLILVAVIIALTAVCARPVSSEDGKVVVTIRDFSKEMTPVIPPYTNDPEAIVLSQNMYSTQPGSRQLRFGAVELIDYDSTKPRTTSAIDALGFFAPTHDSTQIVFAAGGRWFGQVTGIRWQANKYIAWLDTFNQVAEVRPYPSGVATTTASSKLVTGSSAARFTRDIQPGDRFIGGNDTGVVAYVKSDTILYLAANFDTTRTAASYKLSRSYVDSSNSAPFLVSSGDLLFTGNRFMQPQAIYSGDTTLFIRHMGIVDSFYIDSIYNIYPLDSISDTSKAPDSVYRGIPCPTCTLIVEGTGRRSWEQTTGYKLLLQEFQLVSRRKAWAQDEWLTDVSENPEAYFVRVGFPNKDVFFQIAGNTDTSIYCMAWYSDTPYVANYFAGTAVGLPDTIDVATAEGRWGYIYASAGFSDEIVADSQTGPITLRARGGFWKTIDSSFPIDSTEFYKGMYFIQLTGNDVAFDAYTDSSSRLTNRYVTSRYPSEYPFVPDGGDSVLGTIDWYRCNSPTQFPAYGPWRESEADAIADCEGKIGGRIQHYVQYIVYTVKTNKKTKEADFFGAGAFPIRFMSKKGDSLYFVCGVGDAFASVDTATTSNWRIIKTDLPQFAGMAEWNSPPQLVGWGDTASPSLLSFSDVGNPWRWSVQSDVMVGDNPAEPILAATGYDNQLVIFKPHSMVGYPGFVELSQTNGIVGSRALVKTNKEIRWLDWDGVYEMQRRDFSGHSIRKISYALEPVFNSWNANTFGSGVVPFKINPAYRYKVVMVQNQRDQHLYLFFPEGSSTKNNRCVTYDLQRGQWDGYFTLSASDAFWGTIRDTSRIVISGTDSAIILGLDYSYNDVGSGINAVLKSGKFWVADDQGWPVEAVLNRVRFLSRSLDGAFKPDSAWLIITGDTRSDTIDLAYNVSFGDVEQITRLSGNNLSEFWNWEIKTYGDSLVGLFVPYQLQMEFAPVRRDD